MSVSFGAPKSRGKCSTNSSVAVFFSCGQSMPGGFNALRRLYQEVQEPMYQATESQVLQLFVFTDCWQVLEKLHWMKCFV